jgi:hypothetical protein
LSLHFGAANKNTQNKKYQKERFELVRVCCKIAPYLPVKKFAKSI